MSISRHSTKRRMSPSCIVKGCIWPRQPNSLSCHEHAMYVKERQEALTPKEQADVALGGKLWPDNQ